MPTWHWSLHLWWLPPLYWSHCRWRQCKEHQTTGQRIWIILEGRCECWSVRVLFFVCTVESMIHHLINIQAHKHGILQSCGFPRTIWTRSHMTQFYRTNDWLLSRIMYGTNKWYDTTFTGYSIINWSNSLIKASETLVATGNNPIFEILFSCVLIPSEEYPDGLTHSSLLL